MAPPSFRAEVTPSLKTMGEVSAARGRIVTPAEFEPIKEAFSSEYYDVAERVAREMPDTGNSFRRIDSATSYMQDFMSGRSREWSDVDLSPDTQKAVRDLAAKARSMVTEYFEAKPRRIVELSEFAGALVKDDLPAEVEEILRKHGIERIFKFGTNEDRAKLLREFKDLMFSIAPLALLGAGAYAMPDQENMERE